jgi:hypothetical protein
MTMGHIRICKETDCHNAASTKGYCRLHYLAHWKKIKEDAKRRATRKLDKYIEDVMRRHPERYLEVIKEDLESPNFEQYIDETFGGDAPESSRPLESPAYDEEIELLIKKFKIERGY